MGTVAFYTAEMRRVALFSFPVKVMTHAEERERERGARERLSSGS